MSKENLTHILAYSVLPLSHKMLMEQNPKAFDAWLTMFNEQTSSTAGSFQLNKFHELSRKFESHTAPFQPIKAPRSEISKELEIGEDFMKCAFKMVQSNKLILNHPNSPIHILEDGNAILIIESFMLGESDIFHVLCNARRDVVKWGTVLGQLYLLGYITSADSQKYLFVDAEGNNKSVNCVVLTPQAIQYLFSKNVYSVTPSPCLVPTVQPQLKKKLQKSFLDSEK